MRRKEQDVVSPITKVADLELDTNSMAAKRNGVSIELTTKEFALLEYLARNVDKVMTREEILTHVWMQTLSTIQLKYIYDICV